MLNHKPSKGGYDLRALDSASYRQTRNRGGRGVSICYGLKSGNGRKGMLTDEIASSWKKAMNSIQQNERKEMLTDEQASSSQKALISIQQHGRKEVLTGG